MHICKGYQVPDDSQDHLAECLFVHRGSLMPFITRERKIFVSIQLNLTPVGDITID
jgi:hypothetical protein